MMLCTRQRSGVMLKGIDALHVRYSCIVNENTKIRQKTLVPEIKLHLLDKTCPWYYKTHVPELVNDPFWSVFWPGGQALSRFILDDVSIVKKRSAIDLGCGCGATGIAAARSGASTVLCNDIDECAIEAVKLNFQLNNLNCPLLSTENLLNSNDQHFHENSVIFLGDMFYDEIIAQKIVSWCLRNICYGNDIFIGDPGRWGLDFIRDYILQVAEYGIDDEDCDEYKTVAVYQFQGSSRK